MGWTDGMAALEKKMKKELSAIAREDFQKCLRQMSGGHWLWSV